MSEKELNEIISRNMIKNMTRLNLTQNDVAEYMGVAQSTISSWCNGEKLPRMDKVDKLCQLFKVSRSELMEDRELTQEELMQRAFDERPEMRLLFSVAQNSTKEDIEKAIKILDALK